MSRSVFADGFLDAEPRRQHQARLHPGELPRDRAQRLQGALALAAAWPAPDVHRVELGLGGRDAEILEEAWIVVDRPAKRVARVRRQPIHRGAPGGCRWRRLGEGGFERCRGIDLERAQGDAGQPELRLNHLALFGDAQRAVDRSRRLRANREVGWSAAAADAAAPAVEERDRNTVRTTGLDDGLLRLVELPRRGQPADVLGGIRVPDHHLQPALVLHHAVAIPRDGQQRVDHARGGRRSRAVSKSGTTRRGGVMPASRCRSSTARTSDGLPAIVMT